MTDDEILRQIAGAIGVTTDGGDLRLEIIDAVSYDTDEHGLALSLLARATGTEPHELARVLTELNDWDEQDPEEDEEAGD